jgi:hypothetical protein
VFFFFFFSFLSQIVMGRRKDFHKYHGEFPPSNLPLAALGAALLWMGWFGFNAGSALTSGALATSAVASTQIAACSSGIVWLLASWIKVHLLSFILFRYPKKKKLIFCFVLERINLLRWLLSTESLLDLRASRQLLVISIRNGAFWLE